MWPSKRFSTYRNWVVIVVFCQNFFWCCSSPQRVTAGSGKISYLVFGKGGGFSGRSFEYRISEYGNLEKYMENTFTTCGKVSENTTRQIFNNYQKLKLDSVRMNNPGNVYYYIEYKSGGHVSNRIVWGKDPLQNPDITIYFSMLTDAVKKFRNPTVSP